uniref:Uncharacterized protein n=1 Tax=Meloidogyne enterolobii TaxID=390850 RepID=A0A6V7TTD9_MELEN|nr:unnamed protein product [Meloidogyne enterolobii]
MLKLSVFSKNMVSEPDYEHHYDQDRDVREANAAIITMLFIVSIIVSFCCVIYQVMNYQNERAEFERIRRMQFMQYNLRKQQERQYQELQRQQYAYVQPYIVYPVVAAQYQWTGNEQSVQNPPQYVQAPYPPV